jgi:hypothetical protein
MVAHGGQPAAPTRGRRRLYGAWRYDRNAALRHQLAMKDFETRKLVEVDHVKARFLPHS